jgi:hypothetical protein
VKSFAVLYLGAGTLWWLAEQFAYVNKGLYYWPGFGITNLSSMPANVVSNAQSIVLWPVSIYETLKGQIPG